MTWRRTKGQACHFKFRAVENRFGFVYSQELKKKNRISNGPSHGKPIFYQIFHNNGKIPQLSSFARTVHLAARQYKIVNIGVGSRYPSRSVVYG